MDDDLLFPFCCQLSSLIPDVLLLDIEIYQSAISSKRVYACHLCIIRAILYFFYKCELSCSVVSFKLKKFLSILQNRSTTDELWIVMWDSFSILLCSVNISTRNIIVYSIFLLIISLRLLNIILYCLSFIVLEACECQLPFKSVSICNTYFFQFLEVFSLYVCFYCFKLCSTLIFT